MIKFLKSIFKKKKTRTQIYVSSTASGIIFKTTFNTGIFNNGSEVADETEKAYKLCVEYETADGERSGFKNIWCPKSCALS